MHPTLPFDLKFFGVQSDTVHLVSSTFPRSTALENSTCLGECLDSNPGWLGEKHGRYLGADTIDLKWLILKLTGGTFFEQFICLNRLAAALCPKTTKHYLLTLYSMNRLFLFKSNGYPSSSACFLPGGSVYVANSLM